MFKEAIRDVVEGTDGGIAGDPDGLRGHRGRQLRQRRGRFDIDAVGAEFSVILKSIQRADREPRGRRPARSRDPVREGDHPDPHPQRRVLPRAHADARRQFGKGRYLMRTARPEAARTARRDRVRASGSERRHRSGRPGALGPEPAAAGHPRAGDLRHDTLADDPRPRSRRCAEARGAASIAASRTTRVSSSTGSGARPGRRLRRRAHQRRRATRTPRSLSTTPSARSRYRRSRCTSRTPRRARLPPRVAHRRPRASARLPASARDSYVLALRRPCSIILTRSAESQGRNDAAPATGSRWRSSA